MIASEKPQQYPSDYNQFLFIKDLKQIRNGFFSTAKMRDSGNYIYDYAHSFFEKDF